MTAAKYEWQTQTAPAAAEISEVAQALQVPAFLARLLAQRGITSQADYDAFTTPDVARLHDPFALNDMAKAVERIQQAVANQEKITIYGDYDVDGLTSTSIMLETLQSIGAEPEVFIPDRFTDGYGPNAAVYHYLQKSGTQLVITVDNGVSGKAVIDEAMAAGMDVVITDHHELPAELPNAVAVVHPRHPAGDYPFGDLSGAGVAFKVATALLGSVPMESIDLAALGAIADQVSLTDENRIFVQLGLQLIRQQPRPGLAALIKAAGIDANTLDETSVGFGLAPRLNALGRLGDATPGVTLLTTFDDDEATTLATQINDLNAKRQQLVAAITTTAMAMAETPENQARKTLVLAHPDWHEGVLGIVASRIVDATGKPTVVLNISKDGQSAKGSGRSVAVYHLFNAINAVRDQLTAFGGHHMAVGLTVPTASLDQLAAAMEAAAGPLAAVGKPALTIAAGVSASDLTLANYHLLRQLAPFGQGNPEPVFSFLPAQIGDVKALGKTGAHLRFQADGLPVIAFGYGAQAGALTAASQAKLAVTLDQNTWRGNSTLQLQLKDWQLQQPELHDMRLPQPSAEQFRAAQTYVFFSARRQAQLTRRFTFGGPSVLAKDLPAATGNAVLVDLPRSEAELAATMAKLTPPVGLIFWAEPAELVAQPTRLECGRVLHYLQQHPGFDKHHLAALAQATHVSTLQAIFIVQVFFELGFVTIEGAQITATAAPQKRPLTAATAWQEREAFLALATHLQRDSRAELTARLLPQTKS